MNEIKPKYEIIKNYIIEHIKNSDLHYNSRIQSEAELMTMFHVSRDTVRRGIGDLVNDGWLYKQQGKGTFVSDPQANRTSHGKLVGVITTYIKDYIFPEIISGAEHVFSENGYSIILGNTNNNVEKERMILSNMMENNLAGLMIEPTKSVFPNHNKDLFEQIRNSGIPILFIHGTYQNVDSSFIIEDDIMAGEMATNYLIQEGHKKICAVFKQDDIQGHGRYEGYLNAMRKAELPVFDEHILWYTTESENQLYIENNKKKLRRILLENTGIVIYNDQIATKLINVFKSMNIMVPKNISVISFDNSKLAELHGLTTIAHPKEKLGQEAARSLIQLISNEKNRAEVIMQPELVVRGSVNKIK